MTVRPLAVAIAIAPLFVLAGDRPGKDGPIRSALLLFNQGAQFPLPALEDGIVNRLDRGEIVRLRDRTGPHTRAIGLLIVPMPRDRLWLSALDPHHAAAEEVTEVRLTPEGQWPSQWYQLLDLPLPLSDRHWVIDVWNNTDLAESSGNRLWEHAWRLSRDGRLLAAGAGDGRVAGIDPDLARGAIYTPHNEGAWIAWDLGDGRSLLGYHVSTVIDGNIPDDLVAAWSHATLGRVLQAVVERSAAVSTHYDGTHTPLMGGDNRPIAPHP